MSERYLWRFHVQTEAGGTHYLGRDGRVVNGLAGDNFEGTRFEAEAEGVRRRDAFEGLRPGFVTRLRVERLERASFA